MMRRTLVLLGASLPLLVSCSLITGITEDRHVGFIGYPNDLLITVPDPVQVNQPFTVTVRTWGSDGCWRGDRTEVVVEGPVATVTPFDVDRSRRGTECTLALVAITHTGDITFRQTGPAQVVVRGRDGEVTRFITVE